MSELKFDASGAIKKTATLLKLPRAHKFVATEWASDTVRILERSARAKLRSSANTPGKKSSQLWRNIGFLVGVGEDKWTIAIGTGVNNTVSVTYARIQDRGGTTHPRVTDRMRKWAWFMYRKEQGVQAREIRKELPGLSRAKVRETARMGASMYLGIALTKKDRLTVHVPASNWFTGVIEDRKRDLSEMMSPEHVMRVDEGMAAAGGIK